jgi:hypothetical protein
MMFHRGSIFSIATGGGRDFCMARCIAPYNHPEDKPAAKCHEELDSNGISSENNSLQTAWRTPALLAYGEDLPFI